MEYVLDGDNARISYEKVKRKNGTSISLLLLAIVNNIDDGRENSELRYEGRRRR